MLILILFIVAVVLALIYVASLDNIPPGYDGEDLFTLDDDERDA